MKLERHPSLDERYDPQILIVDHDPAWAHSAQAEMRRIAGALAAGGHRPDAFGAAVLRRLWRADRALLAGIAAYRRHPYRRVLADPPAIWSEGGSRLLDFSPPPSSSAAGTPGAAAEENGRLAVLFVPSLVNRAHVLDLAPGRSLLRFVARQD
jgi:polyhydroxyalkanoate synthase